MMRLDEPRRAGISPTPSSRPDRLQAAPGHAPRVARWSQRMSTSRDKTGCCVVGGGPGGMFLALLLARQGVEVTLLEAHHDFDRDFRGDTVHPATLDVLDRL